MKNKVTNTTKWEKCQELRSKANYEEQNKIERLGKQLESKKYNQWKWPKHVGERTRQKQCFIELGKLTNNLRNNYGFKLIESEKIRRDNDFIPQITPKKCIRSSHIASSNG